MMNREEQLAPGTEVRGTDGMAGVIERVDDANATILVRAADGIAYWVPATLVRDVVQEQGQPVVLLQIDLAGLAAYGEAGSAAGTLQTANDGVEVGETLRVPVAAEELVVGKRSITWGTVHLHKGVETAEHSMTVPVYHEEAIIEHLSPDQYDAQAPSDPDEIIIPVVEEQIVVEKRSVIKEYIRVRKTLVLQQQDVRDVVRREYVEIDQPQHESADTRETVASETGTRGR